jgi:subtilisin family serine protease
MGLKAQSLRVYLSDKEFSKTEVCEADVALSETALKKRAQRGVPLDLRDVPVSEAYITQIEKLGGKVKAKSRWFNYVVVESISAQELQMLPFVKRVEVPKNYKLDFTDYGGSILQTAAIDYGLASLQIEMVKGDIMHDHGYKGETMTIAVIDGGFFGTDNGLIFDSLWTNNQILGTKAFTGHSSVYQDGSHGTRVLSILGGYADGQLVGSAPKANYWLLKSEVESSENAVEMDNWMMAAEFADSVGADIITSSLGYNQFDGGVGNYTYSEMDGNTTIVTKAADMAAKKGLLVVVSAGNEGSGAWQHITAPADGDSVLAIGAVDGSRMRAGFSSIGPSADGRLKPDVMAMGAGTANSGGTSVGAGNGTSFSCPVISGLAACMWQFNPNKTNMEIFNAIKLSSDKAFAPNNEYGFGIPNFEAAFFSIATEEPLSSLSTQVFPNPVRDKLSIKFDGFLINQIAQLSLFDVNGRELYKSERGIESGSMELDFPYPEGVYILQLQVTDHSSTYKILK